MHIIIKMAWTAAVVFLLAWPLLFWGKPAPQRPETVAKLHRPGIGTLQTPLLHDPYPRHDLAW